MEVIRWWDELGPSQFLSLFFLLLVIAATAVQVARVAWWVFRAAPTSRLSARVALIARSTRGLARTAVWLTCAGGAMGLQSAMITMESSYPLFDVVYQHLNVLEASAISLGWCALLFAASLAFDLVAARIGRQSVPFAGETEGAVDTRASVLLRRAGLAPGLIALVLVGWLLLDLRPADLTIAGRATFTGSAAFDILDRLWSRLAIILTVVWVLSWLTTLLESAMLRRRLPH